MQKIYKVYLKLIAGETTRFRDFSRYNHFRIKCITKDADLLWISAGITWSTEFATSC